MERGRRKVRKAMDVTETVSRKGKQPADPNIEGKQDVNV